MRHKNVFITGGAGYVGSALVPALLDDGYKVTVYDTLYYGAESLPSAHPNLGVIEGDIRDVEAFSSAVANHDAVINLACISNDASFELDEELSKSVNLDSFTPMVKASKAAGVRRFIYASSSSVYGVSESPDVTETHPLVPLTLYNRFKGECEPKLFDEISDDFVGTVVRPATICGVSPRQRLDLSVNILTNHGFHNGLIKVFGGAQLRPNLHIKDMVEAYRLFLEAEDAAIQGEVFNCGYQNMSIFEIASLVAEIVPTYKPEFESVSIEILQSEDPRSYHVNSEKIAKVLNFSPRFSVSDAIHDLCEAFSAGRMPNSFGDSRYFNVKRMKEIGAA